VFIWLLQWPILTSWPFDLAILHFSLPSPASQRRRSSNPPRQQYSRVTSASRAVWVDPTTRAAHFAHGATRRPRRRPAFHRPRRSR
jgi:hypothetical protein